MFISNLTIDITDKCNFNCTHCFRNSKNHISFSRLSSILEKIKIKHNVCITGGECLIYPNFIDIYIKLKTLKFNVVILTNGSAINNEIIKFFSLFPQDQIHICLYGITENTYEKVTGVKNIFKKVMSNINLLLKNKINFFISTLVTNQNIHEFYKIKEFARKLKVPFKFYHFLRAYKNHENEIDKLRISPEEYVDLELRNYPQIRKYWKKKMKSKQVSYFPCINAKRIRIDTSCNGYLCRYYPDFIKYDLDKISLQDAWNKMINYLISFRSKNICSKCEYRSICDICPVFYHDKNTMEYMCRITKLRVNYASNC
jgi:MoaA/NifB/PqqE/SkfB family radical SAM enzyme